MTNRLHIVTNKDQDVWQLKGENSGRAIKNFPTKAEAIQSGISVAKNQSAELVIHGKNGQIQNSNSYGNDPCPPRDTK